MHKSKLSYDVFIKLVYCFVNELRIIDVRYMLGLAQGTIVDYYNFFREVCFSDLLKKKEKIGGVGKTVEIDESMFGKRKFNKGKRVKGTWVVGGIEREGNGCFLRIVENRDKKTLIELIKENVKEGTKIVTDEWKGYKGLDEYNFRHETVNHSKSYKNPETGETTNKIEGTWSKVSKINIEKRFEIRI